MNGVIDVDFGLGKEQFENFLVFGIQGTSQRILLFDKPHNVSFYSRRYNETMKNIFRLGGKVQIESSNQLVKREWLMDRKREV